MPLRVREPAAPLDLTFDVPDTTRQLRLAYAGEVRFGPPYYTLWISDREDRPELEWGPGPRILWGSHVVATGVHGVLVVERWASLERPDVSVVAVDLVHGRAWTLRSGIRIAIASMATHAGHPRVDVALVSGECLTVEVVVDAPSSVALGDDWPFGVR